MKARAVLTWSLGAVVSVYVVTQILTGCSSAPMTGAARGIASTGNDALVYYTYEKHEETVKNAIFPVAKWASLTDGERYDKLLRIYYANKHVKSHSGRLHAGCFVGEAQDVIAAYFSEKSPTVAKVTPRTMHAWASSDGMAIGMMFEAPNSGTGEKESFHFQLPHCNAGKSPLIPAEDLQAAGINPDAPTVPREMPKFDVQIDDAKFLQSGFEVAPENRLERKQTPKALPLFELKADYENADGPSMDGNLPWRKQTYDVTDRKQALQLAFLAQKYIYENMANQSKNPDMNFNPRDEKVKNFRYWCQMPWQHVGVVGREAIHGLTKERDIAPSKKMKLFANPGKGSDWGVAFYNSPACRTFKEVYGPSTARHSPRFENVRYEDGSFVAKILFSTADFGTNYEDKNSPFNKAFIWRGHLSAAGENTRTIQKARHIQMDIAIRDKSFKNTRPDMNHWIMFTYYFDPDYKYAEYAQEAGPDLIGGIPNLPEGFRYMRPQGIQWGLDSENTIIFTNGEGDKNTVYSNVNEGNRLNGPADNPKSSCMSCHAAAGTTEPISPGFMSNKAYSEKNQGNLDFGQQFALAKRNLELSLEALNAKKPK